jgi:hypothetical protein
VRFLMHDVCICSARLQRSDCFMFMCGLCMCLCCLCTYYVNTVLAHRDDTRPWLR